MFWKKKRVRTKIKLTEKAGGGEWEDGGEGRKGRHHDGVV